MNVDWDDITHVTKVDPAKALPSDLGVLEGTDLVIVGGSDGVTEANTLEAVRTIGDAVPEPPIVQEPYSSSQLSMGTIDAADALVIPAVYNGDRRHFVGKHVDLFSEIGRNSDDGIESELPAIGDLRATAGVDALAELSANVLGEGYVVQHLESAAASRSGVESSYTPAQVAGAALATETFYGFPIFYVEYSGTYGGPTDVEAAARHLEETTLFYGGGIDSREKATEILDAGADAIVVGDCFHDDPEAFRETIPEQ